MNQVHLELLTSEDWADWIAKDLIPRALPSVGLGDHLIEIGPGPGKTTDVLRHTVDAGPFAGRDLFGHGSIQIRGNGVGAREDGFNTPFFAAPGPIWWCTNASRC